MLHSWLQRSKIHLGHEPCFSLLQLLHPRRLMARGACGNLPLTCCSLPDPRVVACRGYYDRCSTFHVRQIHPKVHKWEGLSSLALSGSLRAWSVLPDA